MLTPIILSPSLRYESHALIYAPDSQTEPIRIEGAFGAALLSAMLVDTDEGNRRGIAIDTDADRRAWIARYEREVRPEDWGLLSTELQLLHEAYIQVELSDVSWYDICPSARLLDLALQLLNTYMRHLVVENFCEHIWNYVPWREPFAEWLLTAARAETRRQRFLRTNWTDPAEVTALYDELQSANAPAENPTFIFEGEAAEDIMARYLKWVWNTYQTQLRETPGAQPRAPKHRNFIVEQETDWSFLESEIHDLSEPDRLLWAQWFVNWQKFITAQLKPQKPLRFWVNGVSDHQQAQLIQFLRIQEKEWDYYKCLAASVYALRQLGYIRRACSVADITRWLSEQLVNDYTEKNRRDQFRAAWNELGRYSEDVKHFVHLLTSYGVTRL